MVKCTREVAASELLELESELKQAAKNHEDEIKFNVQLCGGLKSLREEFKQQNRDYSAKFEEGKANLPDEDHNTSTSL